MSRKLRYFVDAAWRATVVTAVGGTCLILAILLLVWIMGSSGRPLSDILPRTLRAMLLLVPAFWCLVFVLEFGSRRRSRRSRPRD